jgi:ribosomal protein L11 methyltransferase
MKYKEVIFNIQPYAEAYSDILSAILAEIGFESFIPSENGLTAYIQNDQADIEKLGKTINEFPIQGVYINYEILDAEYKDWNEVWEEEGFHPIIIDDRIVIHDVKHSDVPNLPYDITISPKLAFGTGSHQTTRMILRELLELDLKGKKVIDAGTGTGILSIMCVKRGVAEVFAYDIDEWSVENTKDNLLLNAIHNEVRVELGDSSVLDKTDNADLILANINRNILLNDIESFALKLVAKGLLLISGFYTDDASLLIEAANKHGLQFVKKECDENWCMLLFEKQ